MRKIALILSIVMLVCCACAAPTDAPAAVSAAPEASEAPAQDAQQEEVQQGGMPPYVCSINFEELDESIKAEDGAEVMLLSGAFPYVEISGNEAATAAVGGFFLEEYNNFVNVEAAEAVEAAKLDYAERGEDFIPYALEMKYETRRADKDCISFSGDGYSYTGGAHPNSSAKGVTFDTKTGKKLEFKDIVTDEAEAREFVNATIKAYLDLNKEIFLLFDDYAEHIPEILEDGQWYFAPAEFVVICNENIVGPHAMGIIEIPIAYSDFTLLKEDYTVAK